MDENILQKLGKVAIKADDSLCVPLDDEDIRVGIRECTSSVILCMFDEVDVNLTGLKMVLQKPWNCDNISIVPATKMITSFRGGVIMGYD